MDTRYCVPLCGEHFACHVISAVSYTIVVPLWLAQPSAQERVAQSHPRRVEVIMQQPLRVGPLHGSFRLHRSDLLSLLCERKRSLDVSLLPFWTCSGG